MRYLPGFPWLGLLANGARGFITLAGIGMRNSIVTISHYLYQIKYEGGEFDQHADSRESLEWLGPVLMTSICAIIGLVTPAIGKGETGKEILHPPAIRVIGGLIS